MAAPSCLKTLKSLAGSRGTAAIAAVHGEESYLNFPLESHGLHFLLLTPIFSCTTKSFSAEMYIIVAVQQKQKKTQSLLGLLFHSALHP